ncbi:G-protein coupled receptor 157-like [Mercenaria mercenaria]|uniref:G-protein coupled receptor 157-like n=1 Tax=Mercenaria mercenaria TaxID=6596 RepID=UPI00234E868A|nr:G-protein coupled receptor 157-like [Mercenaria mercenaria]
MDAKYTIAVYLSASTCVLSILGSFAIFGSYIFIPDIRNSTRKLFTCLTVADFLTALGYLLSALAHFAGTQDIVCTPQSVMTTYSSIVSFYLTIAIAIHIFATVVYRTDTTSSWKFLLWANIISWLIPGIITGLAGADHVLEKTKTATGSSNTTAGTGPWCWLDLQHQRHKLWIFLAGKGWEFLCYLITTSVYVLLKLYRYLRHRRRTLIDIHGSLREEDQNYLYIWFVLYVLRLWGSVRSMMYLAGVDTISPGEEISQIFMYMQAIGDPGQAFCNCILFCFLDQTVRTYIFRRCCDMPEDRTLQVGRDRLIVDSHNYDDNEPAQEEITPDGENSVEHFSEHSGKYKSFGTNKPENFTRCVENTSDSSSRNVSVQSNSSSV